jgi:hypothetical protein
LLEPVKYVQDVQITGMKNKLNILEHLPHPMGKRFPSLGDMGVGNQADFHVPSLKRMSACHNSFIKSKGLYKQAFK